MKLKFHHINLVSKNLDELNNFYNNILGLESLSPDNFLRTQSSDKKGYSGKIKFVSDGNIQMHLAEKDLNVAAENKQFLNPVERGHLAFRTDNIEKIKQILKKIIFNMLIMEMLSLKNGIRFFFMTPKETLLKFIRKY